MKKIIQCEENNRTLTALISNINDIFENLTLKYSRVKKNTNTIVFCTNRKTSIIFASIMTCATVVVTF